MSAKWLQKIIKEELEAILKEQESFADMDSIRTGQRKGISLGGGGLELDSDLANFKPSAGGDEPRRRRRRRFDEPRRADRGGRFVRPQQGNGSSVAAAVRSWNPYPDRDIMELHPEEEQYARKRFEGLKKILSKMLVNSLPDKAWKAGNDMQTILGLPGSFPTRHLKQDSVPGYPLQQAALYGSALTYMSLTNPDLFGDDVLEYVKGLYSSKFGENFQEGYKKWKETYGQELLRRHVRSMSSFFSPQSAQGSDN